MPKNKKPSLIEQACQAMDAGHPERALAPLLECWRASRALQLRELITTLSAQLVTRAPRIEGKTLHKRVVAWWDRARSRDPLDLPLLLGLVAEVSIGKARNMIDELASWPADPRLACWLLELSRDPPHQLSGNSSRGVWQRAATIIGRSADEATLSDLEQRLADIGDQPVQPVRSDLDFDLDATLASHLQRARKAAVKLLGTKRGALDPADEKRCERLRSRLGAPAARRAAASVEQLLLAVYQAPEVIGHRLVLADLLQERGDPRGELIALQCADKRTNQGRKRIKELLRAHQREWLGALAPVVQKTGLAFERGFLSAARFAPRSASAARKVIGRVEWSTVERAELSGWPWELHLAEVLHAPVMRSLRVVKGVSNRFLQLEEPLPLEELELRSDYYDHGDQEVPSLLLTCRCLPALRELRIAFATIEAARWGPVWSSPIGRQIQRFSMTVYRPRNYLSLLPALPPNLQQFELLPGLFQPHRWRMRFDRDDGGAFRLRLDHVNRPSREQAAEQLPEQLPPGVEQVSVAIKSGALTHAQLAAVRKVVGRWRAEVSMV
jgi:uncharacterized protein (TIGR02996 family)